MKRRLLIKKEQVGRMTEQNEVANVNEISKRLNNEKYICISLPCFSFHLYIMQ